MTQILSLWLLVLAVGAGGGTCPVPISPEVDGYVSGSGNDMGEVVWSARDQMTGMHQIYSNIRGQLTSDPTDHYAPSVNNRGDVVWSQYDSANMKWQIYGLIGGELTQLSFDNNDHYDPAIGDTGEVVWAQYDQYASTYHIYSTVQGLLTSDSAMHLAPSVNNKGDVVWEQHDMMGPPQIHGIIGGIPTQVTSEPVPQVVGIAIIGRGAAESRLGRSKFSGRRKPNIVAKPIAMSV